MALFPIDARDDGVRASSSRSNADAAPDAWLRMNSFRASANDAPADGDVADARVRSISPSTSSRDDDDDRGEKRGKKSKRDKRQLKEKKRERREKRLRVDDARKIAALEEKYGRLTRDARVGDVRMRQGRDAYEDARRDGDNLAYGRVARADGVKFRRAVDQAREWYERVARVRESDFYGLNLTCKRERESTKERYFTRGMSSRSDRSAPRLRKPSLVDTAKADTNAEEFVKLELHNLGVPHMAEDGMENAHAHLMQRTKSFNEKTRERPEDVELWIEFARFQDEFMALTRKRSEIRQLVEKKIAILEQALRYHSHDARVIIMLLMEYEKVEESPSIKSRWHYALEQNTGSPDIWHAYLRYRMRDFSNFSASSVRDDFNRALRSLAIARNQLKQISAAPSKVSELERAIVDLIVDVCRFDIQTGETELAVARIQAAVEFCCLSPSTQTEDELVDAFEQFWECGEPRIGEPNATGWNKWMSMNTELKIIVRDAKSDAASRNKHAHQTPYEVPPPPPPPPDVPAGAILGGGWERFEDTAIDNDEDCVGDDSEEDEEPDAAALALLEEQLDAAADIEIDDEILRRWIVKERERCCEIWRPARSMDVQEDEQSASPRVIWFDDIKHGLIRLSDETAKRRLWMQTLRLVGTLDKLPTDFDHDKSLDLIECTAGPYVNASRVFASADGVKHNGTWLSQSYGLEHAWVTADAGRGALGANMFRVFASYDPTIFSCRVVTEKDVAKELLSGVHENSLKLWSHFAKMEWESGRKASARKIYAKVFSTATSAKVQDISHLALSWVECELRESDRENALKVLLALASVDSGEETTPNAARVEGATVFLRAQNLFNQKMNNAFAGGGVWKGREHDGLQEYGIALIQCFAHFQYLNKQTCKEIDDAICAVPPETQLRATNVEHWHSLHVKLLDMKPLATRRSSLECALKVFPRSPHLLLKMCELELDVQGRQRMRRLLDFELERNPNVTLMYYALGMEVGKPFVSNPRVISVLERALQPALITAQSPLLWLTYMRAYVSCGQASSAKTIFLRAINAVPWNKTIWLYGIESLASVFSTKERAALLDVMRGKGISLRTDVFEIQLERAVEAA